VLPDPYDEPLPDEPDVFPAMEPLPEVPDEPEVLPMPEVPDVLPAVEPLPDVPDVLPLPVLPLPGPMLPLPVPVVSLPVVPVLLPPGVAILLLLPVPSGFMVLAPVPSLMPEPLASVEPDAELGSFAGRSVLLLQAAEANPTERIKAATCKRIICYSL